MRKLVKVVHDPSEKMRNRPRTTSRTPMTDALFCQAKTLINGGCSIRKAAEEIGFSEAALRKRLKAGKGCERLGRFAETFSKEQEEAILSHCVSLDQRFFGLTLKSLRLLLFRFAEENGIEHRFSIGKKLAGRDFTRDFLKRNSLSLRVPRKTSIARMMGFNRTQLDNYFDNLTAALTKYGFPEDRTYNMDETGVQTVPNNLPKTVAPTGKREVAKSVAAEQGQTVTVVCSMSAVGHHIPPFFIFARKRMNPQLIKGGPAGCDMAVTDKGYMTSPTFLVWLGHFQKFTNPSAERPVLLILDNHISHVSLEAITWAKEHHIHMLSLPPHSSHKTQPLDRNFFRPFKTFYDSAADSWNVSHPGQVLTVYNVAQLVKIAFERAATVENAVEGFRATGICPLDRNRFSDADFAPSDVTDQGYDEAIDFEDQQFVVFGERPGNGQIVDLQGENQDERREDAEDGREDYPAEPGPSAPSLIQVEFPAHHSLAPSLPSNSQYSSQNKLSNLISPAEIIPLPKVQIKRKRRKGLKSVLLTSTPHRAQLEMESAEKKKLEGEKKKKALERAKKSLCFSQKKQPKKRSYEYSSSSSESETNMSLHNSSSDLDMVFSEDDSDNEKRDTSTQDGDFTIVKVVGKTKNSFRLYVIKIVRVYPDGFDGVFYKRVPNTSRFKETEEEGYVQNNEIYMRLSEPTKTSLGRFAGTISFSEDLKGLLIY